jgi:phosphatidylglycerophosphate synthase
LDAERAGAEASRWLACLLPIAALWSVGHGRVLLALIGPPALAGVVLRLHPFGADSALPNLITAVRVMLSAALALFVSAPVQQAGLVMAIFAIDGLDGWVARRLHATSMQGAHFDMEADAYLVLVVCALLVERVGSWVLLGGLLRYAFVLATWLVPSRGEAPRSRLARYAFAASLTGYVMALLVPGPLRWVPALLATLILCASFGRSFRWSFTKLNARG